MHTVFNKASYPLSNLHFRESMRDTEYLFRIIYGHLWLQNHVSPAQGSLLFLAQVSIQPYQEIFLSIEAYTQISDSQSSVDESCTNILCTRVRIFFLFFVCLSIFKHYCVLCFIGYCVFTLFIQILPNSS